MPPGGGPWNGRAEIGLADGAEGGEQLGDAGRVEPANRQRLERRIARERGDGVAERARTPRIGVAVGDRDQQRRPRQLAGEVLEQQQQRGTVGPVQVLEHEHDRSFRGDPEQMGRDRVEEHEAGPVRVARRTRRGGRRVEDRSELRRRRSREVAQRLRPRPVRGRAGILRTAAGRDDRAAPLGLAGQPPRERGLADPGLA